MSSICAVLCVFEVRDFDLSDQHKPPATELGDLLSPPSRAADMDFIASLNKSSYDLFNCGTPRSNR